MRAMIVLQLFFARKDRLFVDELDDRFLTADTDRIGGRTGTARSKRIEGMLCGAVLQGMEGDDRDSAARIQMVSDGFQRRFNDRDFGIDLYADRLKGFFGRMVTDGEQFFWGDAFDDVHKLGGRFDIFGGSCAHDGTCDTGSVVVFSVYGDDASEICFAVRVDDVVSGKRRSLVHAHIQRRFRVIGEASLGGVQLIGGNAEVEQCAVDTFNAELIQNVRECGEVVFDENDFVFVCFQTFACGGNCGGVLINTDQLTVFQAFDDLQRVTASAQRTVDVNAVGFDIQRFDAFVKQDGNMRKCMLHKSKYPFCLLVIGPFVSLIFHYHGGKLLGMWKCQQIIVENFVETVENLFFDDFDGQHTHYKGYILKMQDFLPKKRRFFSPKLWKNHFDFPKEICREKYARKGKIGFSTTYFLQEKMLQKTEICDRMNMKF